ncbi:hypothetical protein N8I77_003129 [Diaporthe amygdali]|uniref:Uncharacterized protein n=1 Tax=Phomopsis amygdali TaxID=1214568 RepID=A0AAD9SJ50_PHOAM|nr:hypothetical protein N8I77_003129 [Diaporthe amygdali]
MQSLTRAAANFVVGFGAAGEGRQARRHRGNTRRDALPGVPHQSGGPDDHDKRLRVLGAGEMKISGFLGGILGELGSSWSPLGAHKEPSPPDMPINNMPWPAIALPTWDNTDHGFGAWTQQD